MISELVVKTAMKSESMVVERSVSSYLGVCDNEE